MIMRFLCFVFVCCLVACSPASAGEVGVDGYRCKVIRVLDGDTLHCGSGWTEYEKVRAYKTAIRPDREKLIRKILEATIDLTPNERTDLMDHIENMKKRGKNGQIRFPKIQSRQF